MEMKEIESGGRGHVPGSPLDPPMLCLHCFFYYMNTWSIKLCSTYNTHNVSSDGEQLHLQEQMSPHSIYSAAAEAARLCYFR